MIGEDGHPGKEIWTVNTHTEELKENIPPNTSNKCGYGSRKFSNNLRPTSLTLAKKVTNAIQGGNMSVSPRNKRVEVGTKGTHRTDAATLNAKGA